MAAWTPSIKKRGASERDQLVIVNSLIREGRLDEAEQQVDQMLDKHRRSFAATMAMARILMRKKDFQRAAGFYERAARLNEEDAQAPLRAALAYLRIEGDDNAATKAEASLNRVLELDPASFLAHVTLAQNFARKGDDSKAIEHLRQALRIDPANVSARILHARLRNRIGDHDAAIEELEIAAHLKPDQSKVTLHMARLLLRQKDYTSAERMLVEAIQENPKEPGFWDHLGRIRRSIGDGPGAIEAFQEAVNLQPKGVSTRLRLIEALIDEGRTKEARTRLSALPNRKMVKRLSLEMLGNICLAEDRPREACEYLRASLLAAPDGGDKVKAIEADVNAANGAVDHEALARQYRDVLATYHSPLA